MSPSFPFFSLFRPSDETLSSEAKLQLQVYRVLSLLGFILIPLFGVLLAGSGPDPVDPTWARLVLAGVFAALFLASFISPSFRQNYGTWMHGALYVALTWVVFLAVGNDFEGNYAVNLLLAYAAFIAVVGLAHRTIRPVLIFSSVGLLLVSGGFS